MDEFVEASLFGDVHENDWTFVDETAGSDGPGLCVFNGGMRCSSGDSHAGGRLRLLLGGLFWLLGGDDDREQRHKDEDRAWAHSKRQNQLTSVSWHCENSFHYRLRKTPVKITRGVEERPVELASQNKCS